MNATPRTNGQRLIDDLLSLRCCLCNSEESPTPSSCPSLSLHYSEADDSLNTKLLTLADCGYCEGKVVVRT